MKIQPLLLLLPPVFAALAAPSFAQDIGRVSPASLPLPLPAAAPMPPDQLRAHNPWNLPMTGTWKFQLSHGQINTAKQFVPSAAGPNLFTASSHQDQNPPQNAFDSSSDTRWCANGGSFPQALQADLGQVRHVSSAVLIWEFPTDTYTCRIEGRTKDGAWKTLADETAEPGVGSGPLPLTPADVRYVRITVLGTSGTHWASLREFEIRATENGQETAWHPPVPKPVILSAAQRDAFASAALNDARWDTVTVPSNWEMAGYSIPTYDSVDDTVGLYRRTVNIPAAWAGRRIVWHFDGVLDGAEVFVNGQKAGYHESGYTAWDIDLTGLIKPGQPNVLAVRVSKTTPSDDCETGDFQAMGGIYRDTSLIAVPQTRIDDITVQTPLAANYKDATLLAQVHVTGTPGQAVAVTGKLFRRDGQPAGVSVSGSGRLQADGTAQVALSAPVKAPALWSAEKPNLYYVVFSLTGGGRLLERVEQRFGFRQIEIKNNVVLWNGMPIKCTGICRHDFWSDRGFALTEANWVKDLTLMKAANINAVRTSHYNHAQRFLELCDEKGMYILDEVPYCWINDQVKDPAYAPFLLQRGQETLARDKNRPCVLAWSLGNENPYGIASQDVLDMVRKADPTRPAFISCTTPDDSKGQAWEDNHYPGPDSIDRFAVNPKWGTNLTEHPHTFYEKEVQDYDPGASDLWSETLIKTWNKLWKAPEILGSFIWEWQSQGIADKNEDTTQDFYYGLDHLRDENNKGIVDGYRNPKPEWWIVKSVYSPVVVTTRTVSPAGGTVQVPITNHYSFTDLKELACRWTALSGARKRQSGLLHIACGPMQSTTASFPAPAGMTALRLEFLHPDGTSVIAFNLAVAGVPLPAAPAASAPGGTLTVQDGPDALTVRSAAQQMVFDKHTGTIRSWRVSGQDVLLGGPTLNLGEAKAGSEQGMYGAKQPPVTTNAQVSAVPGTDGAVHIAVTSTVLAAAGGPTLGTLVSTYDLAPNAEMKVAWTLNWTAPDISLWEEGVKFQVPARMTQMAWQRDSYFTDYPAGHLGEPSGTAQAGDILFRASKRGLHWLTLSGTSGAGLALLPADAPLIGRGGTGADGTTLFASREVAGPHGLSGAWVEDHAIHAVQGKSLSGSFTLRAVPASSLAAFTHPAAAFTKADADAAVNAYLKAFLLPSGTGALIKGDQNGGSPGFWQEIEEIEGIEDANDRTGGAYNSQVAALLNGFSAAQGVLWSNNIYNDDICWATIAYTRGYQATGNTLFRTIAKANFDMMFARAWDPTKGALYWTTRRTSYNSCIECPAGIASYLLGKALDEPDYLAKARTLFAWEKANLFSASSGAVWDAVDTSGSLGTWSSTYNQGTFVGLANFLGDTASARLAADYTRDHLGELAADGYRIMPEYGSGGSNNSGLNSIGLRWISKFMKDRHLQSAYLAWLQANANTAWSVRRTSDNLSWDQWLQQTPGGVLHSWDCINSVVALQVTPAGGGVLDAAKNAAGSAHLAGDNRQ